MTVETMGSCGPHAPLSQCARNKWLKGVVARTAPFGAVIAVTHPDGATADGLTQIKDGYVESVEDELEVGQDVDVWAQSVDAAEGKMILSKGKMILSMKVAGSGDD